MVFGAVYLGDVMLNTALRSIPAVKLAGPGLGYRCREKFIRAANTGAFDHYLARVAEPRSRWGGTGGHKYRRPYSRRLTNSVENG